jgi:hypothetical protein
MRLWARQFDRNNNPVGWVQVSTDANGFNDAVRIIQLVQVLQLSLGESPLYANYGIPARQSVLTQVFPDFYTVQTQQQFAQYFVSLTVKKLNRPTPTYDINVVTHTGAVVNLSIADPFVADFSGAFA